MPRTYNPDKYPPTFYRILDAVKEKGEVFIPHPHPTSYRGYFQAFLLAVEKNDPVQGPFAVTMMVRAIREPGRVGIVVCDRNHSPAALAAEAALQAIGMPTHKEMLDASARRLLESVGQVQRAMPSGPATSTDRSSLYVIPPPSLAQPLTLEEEVEAMKAVIPNGDRRTDDFEVPLVHKRTGDSDF